MAKVLRAIGLDIGHEAHGEDGAIGGIIWNGRENLVDYAQVWLQVRHPLKVISSATTCKKSSFEKMFKRIGADPSALHERDKVLWAMSSWAAYDAWATGWASFFYQIENLTSVWPLICRMLDVSYVSLPSIPQDVNARKHKDYTWDDLWQRDRGLAASIYLRAKEHGYS